MPEDRRLVPEFTVEENIRLPTWTTQADGVEARLEWIFSIMPEVARFRTRRALELSRRATEDGGARAALMAGTRILLLAEPFDRGCPRAARARLGEVLCHLKSEGVSVLIARDRTRCTSSTCWRAPISSEPAA